MCIEDLPSLVCLPAMLYTFCSFCVLSGHRDLSLKQTLGSRFAAEALSLSFTAQLPEKETRPFVRVLGADHTEWRIRDPAR